MTTVTTVTPRPRPRLILHIGSHKTGSTALQGYLARNRAALRRAGVFYPRPEQAPGLLGSVHRDLRDAARAEAFAGRAGPVPAALGSFDALLDRYIARIRAQRAPVTILSCESWGTFHNIHAPRLTRLSDSFDVSVVCFIRRTDHYLESFYRQRIQSQERADVGKFNQFAGWWLPTRAARWAQVLGWWADAFGAHAVTAVPFAPAEPGFSVQGRFWAAAGLDPAMAPRDRWAGWQANPSLTRHQAEVVRLAMLRGGRLNRVQMWGLRQVVRGADGPYMGPEARAAMLALTRQDEADVAARHVRDGRETLFPTAPEKLHQPAQDWDHILPEGLYARAARLLRLPPEA